MTLPCGKINSFSPKAARFTATLWQDTEMLNCAVSKERTIWILQPLVDIPAPGERHSLMLDVLPLSPNMVTSSGMQRDSWSRKKNSGRKLKAHMLKRCSELNWGREGEASFPLYETLVFWGHNAAHMCLNTVRLRLRKLLLLSLPPIAPILHLICFWVRGFQ